MTEIIKDYKFLTQMSSRVDSIDEAKSIIDKLENTLSKYPNGYGLSAIQIGIPKRIAVIKYGRHSCNFIHLINPEFVEKGEPFTFYGEGCLSFPNIYMETQRLNDFTISNDVIDGNKFRNDNLYFYHSNDDYNKLESIAIEHEMEHMMGRTLLDFGKPIKKAIPIVKDNPKIGRNDPCPCGSLKKFKKCCLGKD